MQILGRPAEQYWADVHKYDDILSERLNKITKARSSLFSLLAKWDSTVDLDTTIYSAPSTVRPWKRSLARSMSMIRGETIGRTGLIHVLDVHLKPGVESLNVYDLEFVVPAAGIGAVDDLYAACKQRLVADRARINRPKAGDYNTLLHQLELGAGDQNDYLSPPVITDNNAHRQQ